MSRSVFFTQRVEAEVEVFIEDVIDEFGRDALLEAMNLDRRTIEEPRAITSLERLLLDIELEAVAARDQAAKLALWWCRDRIKQSLGVTV